jgi:hypothetical protein
VNTQVTLAWKFFFARFTFVFSNSKFTLNLFDFGSTLIVDEHELYYSHLFHLLHFHIQLRFPHLIELRSNREALGVSQYDDPLLFQVIFEQSQFFDDKSKPFLPFAGFL